MAIIILTFDPGVKTCIAHQLSTCRTFVPIFGLIGETFFFGLKKGQGVPLANFLFWMNILILFDCLQTRHRGSHCIIHLQNGINLGSSHGHGSTDSLCNIFGNICHNLARISMAVITLTLDPGLNPCIPHQPSTCRMFVPIFGLIGETFFFGLKKGKGTPCQFFYFGCIF